MQIIDWIVVALYLGTIVALGFWLQRRASGGIEAYFLGDRDLPWWALGASGMASNTDIAGTMGITALVYALGTQGFFIELRGGIVLVMAFFAIFMGKWMRRSQAMTLAEWMELRFGTGAAGRWARAIAAVANLVVSIWILSFFATGGGKFFGLLLGIDDRLAAMLTIVLAGLYTAVSGFYGVIWTDVFQGVLIFVAILYVCAIAMQTVVLPESFMVSVPAADGQFVEITNTLSDWSRLWPAAELDLPGQYSAFNFLGVTVGFYFLKTVLEGMSGVGGYISQRYFAARSDREVGLLSAFWILLLSFRWPLVTAFAVLGIHHGLTRGAIADPELVLPTVLDAYIPVGIKGLLVACFVAAAMSTFDSIINSSAAFWVRDLYQGFINPQATERQLIWHSRISSLVIMALGLAFSFSAVNVNDIWGWLTFAMGSGLFVPLLLRWYWWRFNGFGFAIGMATGAVSAIALRLSDVTLPEYANFLLPSGLSLLGCLIGTYLTPATDTAVLENFYRVTRPFGFWGSVGETLPRGVRAKIAAENQRDAIAVCLAVPWQLVLFLSGMMAMMQQWDSFGLLVLVWLLLSIGLYFTWYRHLSKEVRVSDPKTAAPASEPSA
ncbi:Na+/proline symporter [Rubidibacter lacunae KORDI 51-2]|uniref:Na+/proline symporter n=1 Tax=Rubidibacter lacunae KORDI 51-2 TaxID=582515 RepID=U5DI12_9CHRO|nr:Na+/proline symporter [Rubidibacter lacunae]ERN41311.1 Na+/proline symporter [Rubidibacter lacunae KORDI 51-2]